MKRNISVILILCMLSVFLVIPVTAASVNPSGTCGDDLKWEIDDDGTLIISGTGNMTNWNSATGFTAPWANYYSIKTVRIENGVTSVGDSAFDLYNCSKIVSVKLADSVKKIGRYAFKGNTTLEEIVLSDNLTVIEERAFDGCVNLKKIGIPDSVTDIKFSAFEECRSLTEICLPKGITEINSQMFRECYKLESITILGDISSIGAYVFDRCNKLKDIYYSGTEEDWNNISIGKYGNDILTKVNIHYVNEANGGLFYSPQQYTEIECQNCFEKFKTSDEDLECIICPYCDEPAGGSEDAPIGVECSICGEIIDVDEIIYDDNGEGFCENCIGNNSGEEDEYTDDEYEDADHSDDDYNDEDEYAEDDEYENNGIIDMDDLPYEEECWVCGEVFSEEELTYDDNDNAICLTCAEMENSNSADESIEDETPTFSWASDWALSELNDAYNMELIPEELLDGYPFTLVATRAKFAALAVRLYENLGCDVPDVDVSELHFTDCDANTDHIEYIAAAYKLGIVNGTSATTFEPNYGVRREELATMLYRVIMLAEKEGSCSIGDFNVDSVRKFNDDSYISDYAQEPVYFMAENGIVKGVDGAHFMPLDSATLEQAIIISLRCAKRLAIN